MTGFYLVYVRTVNEVDGVNEPNQYFARVCLSRLEKVISAAKGRQNIVPQKVTVYNTLENAIIRNSTKLNLKDVRFEAFWGGPFQNKRVTHVYFKNIESLRTFYGQFLNGDGAFNEEKADLLEEEVNNRNNDAPISDTTYLHKFLFRTTEPLKEPKVLPPMHDHYYLYNPKTYYANYIIKTSLTNELVKIGYTDSLEQFEERRKSYITSLPGFECIALVLIPVGKFEHRLDTQIKRDFPRRQYTQEATGSRTEWLRYNPDIINTYFGYLEDEEQQQQQQEGEEEDQQQDTLFQVTPLQVINRFEQGAN